MIDLRPCTECNRHVRADHDVCPFCAATMAPHVRRAMPTGRLTRAAVFASALAGVGASGCGTNPEPVDPNDDQHILQQHDTTTTDGVTDTTTTNDNTMPAPTPDAMLASPVATVDAGVPVKQPPKPAVDAAGPLVYPKHDHPSPKPYGAPPARTRLV